MTTAQSRGSTAASQLGILAFAMHSLHVVALHRHMHNSPRPNHLCRSAHSTQSRQSSLQDLSLTSIVLIDCRRHSNSSNAVVARKTG